MTLYGNVSTDIKLVLHIVMFHFYYGSNCTIVEGKHINITHMSNVCPNDNVILYSYNALKRQPAT